MSRRFREARRHLDRIEHYHKYAGPYGYQQAVYHYEKLVGLVHAAAESGEGGIVSALFQEAGKLMKEMEQRKTVLDEPRPERGD